MSLRPDAVTQAVRAGLESDEGTGAVVPPIHLSTTYAFRGFADKRPYDYSRSGNPTRDLLGKALADLEGGVGAAVLATGMAAITLVGHLLPVGARIVAPHDCYGGTYRLFDAWRRRGELHCDFVDFGDAGCRACGIVRSPPRCYGSRRPAIHCCASPILCTSPNWVMPPAHWSRSTIPSCRRYGRSHWRWAPTWSCTRPQSI